MSSSATDTPGYSFPFAISSPTIRASGASAATTSRPYSYYFSRRSRPTSQKTHLLQVPMDAGDWIGYRSPFAWMVVIVSLCVPLAYIYIGLILLRELCWTFPDSLYAAIQHYIPPLARLIALLQKSSTLVEAWCVLEALFFLAYKGRIRYLQSLDTLKTSLSSAPIMNRKDRETLWQQFLNDNLIDFLSGWFFDQPIHKISRYDLCDFLAWSMFEGRNQEHLTSSEQTQLEGFVADVEWNVSLQLYGAVEDDQILACTDDKSPGDTVEIDEPCTTLKTPVADAVVDEMDDINKEECDNLNMSKHAEQPEIPRRREFRRSTSRTPKRMFHFQENSHVEERNLFSELYETYSARYEQLVSADAVKDLTNMMANATPDLSTFVAETSTFVAETKERIGERIGKAEESAIATTRQVYERLAPIVNETKERIGERIGKAEESAIATTRQVYERLVPIGSPMDKQLKAMSRATRLQFLEAWNSMKHMRERLETARDLSKRRQTVQQELLGYRVLLGNIIDSGLQLPIDQLASIMRRITECNEALDSLEYRAQSAFSNATGFALKNFPFLQREEPKRFAKYSSDPLINVSTYPLGFYLMLLGGIELALRVMMRQRGFERRTLGQVAYYFHPGKAGSDEIYANSNSKTPIVFVHGIGVGLLVYMPLIDALLESGRPIFLPEIPYVSAFRFWLNPHSVLKPAVVCSTMSAMLASHGFLQAVWAGHSYGTSWVSYLCKYAPHAVAGAVFLDPICFCLHYPRLTKSFVYMPPDPGNIAYFVRTDVIVNWTIQRSFPWAWIILFTEQIKVPFTVFLGSKDLLVPSKAVETYLRRQQVPIHDANVSPAKEFQGDANCCVLEMGHGEWTESPTVTVPKIAEAIQLLTEKADQTLLEARYQ